MYNKSNVTSVKRNFTCKVIFLPEACDYIAESHAQSLELAENIDGSFIKSYSELAVQNHIWISIGGFHNRVTTNFINFYLLNTIILNCLAQCSLIGKMYNTHLIIDSDGK